MNLLRRVGDAAADLREAQVRRGTLARRLILAVTALLLPLVVVTLVGVVMFRSSISSLEEFQRESVDETARVVEARDLLSLSDDVGEQYVEAHDPVSGEEFRSIGRRLISSLDGLSDLSSEQEIAIIAKVRARWVKIDSELNEAAKIPLGDDTGPALDPFHDDIDEALSLLADLNELRGVEIADEIATMRRSEQLQLLFGLAMLGVGIASAFLLARWARRAITGRLGLLEGGAVRIGSDDLSHRVDVGGDDELTRVGDAFNTMAGRLERSRTDLERQAYHDPLTGLANRELFMDRIGHEKDRARRRGEPFSVLYLDLDGFKVVNDSRGHHVGDEVLQVAATRMAACLRPEDTLARLGGDEFGVLLEETGAAAAAEVADRLVHAVGDTPFAGHDLSIGVSVGITTGGTDDDVDRLLREADAAMYSAKANGGSAWRAFDPVAHLDGVRTQSVRAELQRAAEQHEFVVHYQPVVRLETGAVEAVEALVRWQHPERGLLPPAAFLDAAAATGHILFIDNWVMHEACRQVKAWQTSVPGAAGLSAYVNFSASQLRHPGLASSVADALRASGLRAQDLVVELTEGAIVDDLEAAATELQQLRKLGVRIALDDFGTGYSSMSHLLRFPVDIIKVDRSFVSQMDDGGQGSNLAQALVTFGRTMGFQTIGEGIEEPHQLGLLRSVHCELGQGYLFANPSDADQLGEILSRSLTIDPEQSATYSPSRRTPTSSARS
jgi:diguanylate cyclase (GGDEF)-like protein